MLRLVLFGIGLASGAGGTAAWLLSEPGSPALSNVPMAERLDVLKQRLDVARAEGAAAGAETQNRIRHELDAYRLHPDRPGISS